MAAFLGNAGYLLGCCLISTLTVALSEVPDKGSEAGEERDAKEDVFLVSLNWRIARSSFEN